MAVARGHDDYRDQSQTVVGLQPLHDAESIAGWQAEIQNNQVRHVFPRFRDARHPVRRKNDVIVVCFETYVEAQPHIGIVIYDKNFLIAHFSPSSKKFPRL